MEEYSGPDRRGSSPDTIMVLGEIKNLAVIVASLKTSVELLRNDFSDMKKTAATNADLARIENRIDDHFSEHKESKDHAGETKKWAIGAIIAAGTGLLSFLGSFIPWHP